MTLACCVGKVKNDDCLVWNLVPNPSERLNPFGCKVVTTNDPSVQYCKGEDTSKNVHSPVVNNQRRILCKHCGFRFFPLDVMLEILSETPVLSWNPSDKWTYKLREPQFVISDAKVSRVRNRIISWESFSVSVCRQLFYRSWHSHPGCPRPHLDHQYCDSLAPS